MVRDIDQEIVDDIRRFDYVAQNIWPWARWLFKGAVAPRCTQCVISSKVPYVTLKDGLCDLCREYNASKENEAEKQWQERYVAHQRRALDELLKSYEGMGRGRWDAVVLFSG